MKYGVLVNSAEDDGLPTEEGKKAILARLNAQGLGGEQVNYRLRDWLFSHTNPSPYQPK